MSTAVQPLTGLQDVAAGLLKTARPRQWIKNVLVLAAPLAAGTLLDDGVAAKTAVAFVAFCFAASGTYLVNDALDVEADRAHPRKRHRPVASGRVAVPLALAVGGLLMAVALVLSIALSGYALLGVMVTYICVQLTYCLWLKHQAVLDIALVASGFLLRAVAGAAATGVSPSQWFLLVASFGSLFMVAGKRYAELTAEVGKGGSTRRALNGYTPSYLRFVWGMSATVVVLAYSLWSFELSDDRAGWGTLSIAPLTLAVLRYAVDVDAGIAGEPEEIVAKDRVLQLLGVVWLLMLSLSIYAR